MLIILLATFATGCNSVPQKRALLAQVERDTQGVDPKILNFDSTNRVATVQYHHRIVYGKMSAVRYQFDGTEWERIEGASNTNLEPISGSQ